jgi:hypothetical protein
MIQPTGFSGGTINLAKIIFLFQSIDCILPAKLGDVYGAHLMKLNFAMSRSFSLGSIFLWRIIDFVMVMAITVTAAFLLFGKRIPPDLFFGMEVAGFCLVVLLVLIGLFFYYHKWFPISPKSERLKSLIDSFHHGLKLKGRRVPLLLMTTLVIWFLEAGRFFFVCKSMGVEVNMLSVLFITSSTVFLTAIPFTPSGLGAVELGMVKLLSLIGIGNPVAYPLIIWDRVIAHWSQILFGIIFILFSKAANVKIWQFKEEMSSSKKRVAIL